MSSRPCCICGETKTGMTYSTRAFCFPCRDLAIESYLEVMTEA